MADNLQNEFISQSFQRLLQVGPSSKEVLDGTGSAVQLEVQGLSGSFSGSFQGDGSKLTGVGGLGIFSQTGSTQATTNDVQITGSLTILGQTSGSFTGSFQGDGSQLTGITGGIFTQTGSSFNTTNNLQISGSVDISGSLGFFDTDCGFF